METYNRRLHGMTNVERLPPSALELEAFIDDELSSSERIRVVEWLLANPEKALDVFQTMLREELLRAVAKQNKN